MWESLDDEAFSWIPVKMSDQAHEETLKDLWNNFLNKPPIEIPWGNPGRFLLKNWRFSEKKTIYWIPNFR